MSTYSKVGNCEVCDKTGIAVFTMHGNIQMCDECREIEQEVIRNNKTVNAVIESSRQVDNSIQLKADIYNAQTVAAIELKAAIDHDDSIPEDKKEYAFALECQKRYNHFKKVVFDTRASLNEAENAMRMWQVTTQTESGKLRAEYRAQFKDFDIQYQPTTPKTIKPKVTKSKAKKVTATEAKEAGEKFGVPANAVLMVATQRNMTAIQAAEFLAKSMGVKK